MNTGGSSVAATSTTHPDDGSMRIRALSHSDLADVARIQRECYGHGFIESVDSFAAKLAANAEFSFLATRQNVAVGYAVAFPWAFGEIPALNGLEYSIPPNADSLYIHDIAVVPTARGTGTARLLLDTVLSTARSKGYRRAFLVAVQGGAAYWRRHGFEPVPHDEKLARYLAAYGEGAVCMTSVDETG